MKERPILFSAQMVQAILDGRKSCTRRVLKTQPYKSTMALRDIPETDNWYGATARENEYGIEYTPVAEHGGHTWKCPYGSVGDRLWVKEAYYAWGKWVPNGLTKRGRKAWKFAPVGTSVRYMDGNKPSVTAKRDGECGWVYRHGRFMPKKHSRITLEVTDIRIERLQDITEEDAIAEGITAQDVYAWSLKGANAEKVEQLCWIETPKCSSDEDYCSKCADKKLVEVIAKRGGDSTDCFVDGGFSGYESDGPRFCETCGITLEVSYTDYAVEQELDHFKDYGGGTIGDYEINRLAAHICGEEQEMQFAKVGFRWLWRSINGKESWDANPWVWVINLKELDIDA